jgi:hypothetical protein
LKRPRSIRDPGTQDDGRTEELEGFSIGIAHRLRLLRDQGSANIQGERELARARGLLAADDALAARAILERLDSELRKARPESELREFPRGLVDYTPTGDRGVPVPRDDEPIANRLVLVERLLDLRRSQGADVENWSRELTAAEAAYRAGDRPRAREICDRVHAALDAWPAGAGRPSRSGRTDETSRDGPQD